MDHLDAASRLEASGASILALLQGLKPETLRHRPAPDRWCLLEVLGHLVDEEKHDFAPRLFSTLEDPDRAWPAYDPEAAVAKGGFRDVPAHRLQGEFRRRRTANLRRLRGLRRPDWDHTYAHPSLGPLRAGDLLAAWVDHDLLHLRQMLGVLHAEAGMAYAPFTPAYAGGSWEA